MSTKINASVKTLFKYLFWTAIAAVATATVDQLSGLTIPDYYVPIIGAALKSIATFAATQRSAV